MLSNTMTFVPDVPFGSVPRHYTHDGVALWKAAPYLRLSKEDGDKPESDSISNQKDLVQTFVRNRTDIELTGLCYADDGYSGVSFDRPDFQRMLEDIRAGHINCVIVKDLSRLGRNYIEMGKLLERFFPFMGVRFIAVNDSYDSQNHNGQTDNLIIPFKNLINDAYSADTSNKIRSQLEVKRKKGDYIGSFAPFGYRKDPDDRNRLIIDEKAAATVQDIFRWKMSGMSQQGIADRLNEMGVASPLEYKKKCGSKYTTVFNTCHKAKWTAVSVGRILRNEVYTGVLTQGISTTPNYKVKQRIQKTQDEWVRTPQAHDWIISMDDFALVSDLLRKDTRIAPGGKEVYLFSGMLRCADCSRNLVRKNVPGRAGVKYYYYVCSTFKKGKGCKSHSISEKALFEAVFKAVALHIEHCTEIGRMLSFIQDIPLHTLGAERLQRQIGDRKTELDKLNQRQLRLYDDYTDEILSRDEYTEYKAAYAKQIEETQAARELLEQELAAYLKNGNNNGWLEHFRKHHGIKELTRGIVIELIERITVYEGGRIEVRFRFQQNFDEAMHYLCSLPDERVVS